MHNSNTLPFSTVDVFTETSFEGNPLAIVEGAGALSTAQMQTIAREFNLSETIFVRPPRTPQGTAEVRIFFPTAEIPFAGHPTIGLSIYIAAQLQKGKDTPWQRDLVLETQAGPVHATVTHDGTHALARLTAPVLPKQPTGATPKAAELAELAGPALGLAPEAIGFGAHAPAVWQAGPTFTLVPLADLNALGAAAPQSPAWEALCDATGTAGVLVYARDQDAEGPFAFRSRFFAPGEGIPEDPATGSATVMVAAQLLAAGTLCDGATDICLTQGVEMGRRSRIGLHVDVANGALRAVALSGSAVAITRGEIRVP